MTKTTIHLLIAAAAISATALSAEEAKTNASGGTLKLSKETYPLRHALAYEATIDNEPAIAVVVSGQVVPGEILAEARAAEKEGGDGDFKKPFLKLVFTKAGELKHWSAAAGSTSFGRQSGNAKGQLKLAAGRVTGQASQVNDPERMIPSAYEVRFDTALLKASETLPASTPTVRGPAANVKPSVTGVFKGNGKEAKLAYASARWVEPFSGQPGLMLLFTEKDHAKVKKPDFDAMFGQLGSALIISLHEDGAIYSCQVVHSAHQKKGFSSIGTIHTNGFTYAEGKVAGELTTDGQLDTFGETWEVKIQFVAPLGDIPKEFQVPETKKPEKEAKPVSPASDDEPAATEPAEKPTSQPAPSELEAKDLALTKDATSVEYNSVVEHVLFKSKSDVKSVCAELAANLKAQGWTSEGHDLIQPKSSILKRQRGEAGLTIFVKPENGGSEVKMFTEGLSWGEE